MFTSNAINNSVKVTEYITNDTWHKDPRTKLVTIIGWNGGGGGGSGRQSVTTGSSGGGGGANGATIYATYPASFFGAAEAVVVGAGGAGGLPQTVADTDGNAAGPSGISSLGNVVISTGLVTPGQGGSITNNWGPGGAIELSYMNGVFYGVQANYGGYGYIIEGTSALTVGSNTGFGLNITATSGGGGGGADSLVERTGGDGGNFTGPIITNVLIPASPGGIESGTIDGADGTDALTTGGIMSGGTGGGGGGGQSVGLVAGKGGDGGFPGGGGGGGGGSLNGTNSGAGGKGGDGKIIVIEYF